MSEIDLVAPLFNAYRIFYGQPSDLEGAKEFLMDRLTNQESIIFLAVEEGIPLGFTQLYTTFSSVSMQPFYILNDLFVVPKARKKGVGEQLLNQAKILCQANDYKGVALETAVDNPAQKLYERLGWQKDQGFFHYFWMNEM
nr:GNAT family N-acetyltransferase [Allomuricauda sp.]